MERIIGINDDNGKFYRESPFLTPQEIDGECQVFSTDTDMYISLGADASAQRQSNRMTVFSLIASMLLKFGQKTLLIVNESNNITGDIKSTFRKKLALTYFSFERGSLEQALPYTEQDYERLISLSKENDDIRSIFVYGSTEEVTVGKRLASELKLPLVIFVVKPDGDSFLSPYYVLRKGKTAEIAPAEPPKMAFFDCAEPLTERAMKRGAGFIAKALMTLSEVDYLGESDYSDKLLSVIKDCLFTDFGKITVANKCLLYKSLLKLSALKSDKNGFLFTAADGLTETLSCFGIDGKDYAYSCSMLIAEIYSDVLSFPELNMVKPPDTLSRFRRLQKLGLKAQTENQSFSRLNFSLACQSDKITQLVKSLSLFESSCLTDKLPLSPEELHAAIIASACVYGQKSLLHDLYLAGYLPS